MRTGQNLDLCCESILIYPSRSSFVLCLSSLLAVLLPTLSSFFCMEFWLANFFRKGTNNLQIVVGKQRNWRCFPPKSYLFVSLTLLGLVRISKRRYRWKVLSLVTLLLATLLTYTESLMGPGRKICIVPRGKKTTKAVVEGLKGLEISCSGFNCRKRSLCPIHNN